MVIYHFFYHFISHEFASGFWPYQQLNSTDWKHLMNPEWGNAGYPWMHQRYLSWGNVVPARIPNHGRTPSYISGKGVPQVLHWQRSSPPCKDRTKTSLKPQDWKEDSSGWQKPQIPSRIAYQLRATEEATHGSTMYCDDLQRNYSLFIATLGRECREWDPGGTDRAVETLNDENSRENGEVVFTDV